MAIFESDVELFYGNKRLKKNIMEFILAVKFQSDWMGSYPPFSGIHCEFKGVFFGAYLKSSLVSQFLEGLNLDFFLRVSLLEPLREPLSRIGFFVCFFKSKESLLNWWQWRLHHTGVMLFIFKQKHAPCKPIPVPNNLVNLSQRKLSQQKMSQTSCMLIFHLTSAIRFHFDVRLVFFPRSGWLLHW